MKTKDYWKERAWKCLEAIEEHKAAKDLGRQQSAEETYKFCLSEINKLEAQS